MENNKKDELKDKIYAVLDEFERIIKNNSDKIPSFYLNETYFSNLIKKLEEEEYNDINKLNMDHIFLVEEFGSFIIEYEIDHNQIAELILNHIKKYVMLDESQEQDKSINNTDSEDELKEVVARKQKELIIDDEEKSFSDADSEDEDSEDELKKIVKETMKKKSVIDSEEDENISNGDSEDEPKKSIINNEPK